MKEFLLTIVVGAIVLCTACEDDSVDLAASKDSGTIVNIKSDGPLFDSLMDDRTIATSDAFWIRTTWRTGNQLMVVVQYGGGCQKHTFDIAWDPDIQLVPDDEVGFNLAQLIIVHDGNGDQCEAALTDTLTVSLSELDAITDIDQLNVRVLNGSSDQSFSVVTELIGIPEHETCEYEVVLTEVICGDGLFENKWFRITPKDQPTYLQPVSLAALTQLAPNQPIGRYKVGVKVTTWTPDSAIAICQAYPGPSVPVEIWCMELIEQGEF